MQEFVGAKSRFFFVEAGNLPVTQFFFFDHSSPKWRKVRA